MKKMDVKKIAEIINGTVTSSDSHEEIRGFSIDSRTILPGEFFIAIKGKHLDGHEFLYQASQKGARGIIVSSPPEASIKEKFDHVIKVEDTLLALERLAENIRKTRDLPVICVTGTNGKTTVKEMLVSILSSWYKVLANKDSYNNIIGLSLTLLGMEEHHDLAVLELGTSGPGEIERLAKIAKPECAVITNIGRAHLEGLGSREKICSEKTSVLKCLPEKGIAFLNGDDALLKKNKISDVPIKYYGMSEDCDVRISRVVPEGRGYNFSVNDDSYFVPLKGLHNVYNAAVSIAVAKHFGLDQKQIQKGLSEVCLPKGRLEKSVVKDRVFINDAYNANPDSFECALSVLAEERDSGNKVVVAGDMLELGDDSRLFHTDLGKHIKEKGIDYLITLGKSAGDIAAGAIASGMAKDNVIRAKSYKDAARVLDNITAAGSTILLKGSRGSKIEEVLKCFTSSYTS